MELREQINQIITEEFPHVGSKAERRVRQITDRILASLACVLINIDELQAELDAEKKANAKLKAKIESSPIVKE